MIVLWEQQAMMSMPPPFRLKYKTFSEALEVCGTPNSGVLTTAVKDAFLCEMRTRFLLARVDQEGAILWASDGKANLTEQHKPGFAVIGYGEFAKMSLFARCCCINNVSLAEAVYFVYEAKKMAENASGVGKETDIAVIRAEAGLQFLSEDARNKLESTREKLKPQKLSESDIGAIQEMLFHPE
ncbi:MAG TPA: hypothetical protein VEL76_29990 [Gemmataceae bacterium]|nr:hypothetical protein [Gemmataceae bacterium]